MLSFEDEAVQKFREIDEYIRQSEEFKYQALEEIRLAKEYRENIMAEVNEVVRELTFKVELLSKHLNVTEQIEEISSSYAKKFDELRNEILALSAAPVVAQEPPVQAVPVEPPFVEPEPVVPVEPPVVESQPVAAGQPPAVTMTDIAAWFAAATATALAIKELIP